MESPSWDRSVRILTESIPVESRRLHIWGVVETALSLATHHGVDPTKAAWAALLHDCAKCLDREKLASLLKTHHLGEEKADEEIPTIWHAFVGGHLAAHTHGIREESILKAIRYHPTGASPLDPLGLVLFVADYTEPTREYEMASELRRMAFERPLEETALEVCRNKIRYVQGRGRPVHPRSLKALRDLEKRVQELRKGHSV